MKIASNRKNRKKNTIFKRPMLSHLQTFLKCSILTIILRPADGVLDISPSAAYGVADNIRSHIFVDHRYVKRKEQTVLCDSLGGPLCGVNEASVTGILPIDTSRKLQIDLDVLHHALPLELWNYDYTSVLTENYMLPAPSSLILRDLPEGGRITTHYSMSLPGGSGLAKLEGRWLLDDSVSMETFLPAYIKFSQPVLVKNLWADLTIPSDFVGKSVVIVAFRLGTETVWTTEAIIDPGFTIDLTSRGADGHGPLRACDQIVIFSTVRGLQIRSIEFEDIKDQVLVPTVLLVPGRSGSLGFKHEKVDATALVSRQIISVKEVIDKGYYLDFPTRESNDPDTHLAELVARDIGMIVPVDQVYTAIRSGKLVLPHELKKALLKHEKDINKIVKSLAKRALHALVHAPEQNTTSNNPQIEQKSVRPISKRDKELQTISDLFIAALMHS